MHVNAIFNIHRSYICFVLYYYEVEFKSSEKKSVAGCLTFVVLRFYGSTINRIKIAKNISVRLELKKYRFDCTTKWPFN